MRDVHSSPKTRRAMDSATVIIVNYNGAHLLPACLEGLACQQEDGPTFRTVVVDNASADDSRDVLARDYPWVHVIASDTNLGFAAGNNLALRQVTTPFAVLLNNDAVPEPGWLRHLLAPFDTSGGEQIGMTTGKVHFLPKFAELSLAAPAVVHSAADPRDLGVKVRGLKVDGTDVFNQAVWEGVAWHLERKGRQRFRWTKPTGDLLVPLPPSLADATGALVRDVCIELRVKAERDKTLTLGCGGRVETVTVGPVTRLVEFVVPKGTYLIDIINNAGNIILTNGCGGDRGYREVDRGQYDEPVEVFAACGNGMAMRTEVGRQLGFFDDDYFMYYEDMDLSWRLRALGWSIHYVPDAVVRHVHAASSVEGSRLFTFNVDRNRLLTLTKNAPASVAAVEVFGFMFAYARLLLCKPGGKQALSYASLQNRNLARRVVRSYVRLLPRILQRRCSLRRAATVAPDRVFTAWSVSSR